MLPCGRCYAHFYFPGYTGSGNGEAFGGTASVDLDAYLAALANIMINGPFASYPGGVDATLIQNATGDPLNQPAWFP